jgi:predicted transcriptional regulator
MRDREYKLLEAISEDETVTQAGLAKRLDIAVGSVNWYIKRLISRGYLKATRMDRTRLRYNLTAEGMGAFTRNATQYMRDSLFVYRDLRLRAQAMVEKLEGKGIEPIAIIGEDEIADILRLTCIEAGIEIEAEAAWWVVNDGSDYVLKKAERLVN